MNEIDTLCINTIRSLSMDAIGKADSGHPGTPMGLAPAAYTLWTKVLKHNPSNPKWFNRDRFVLSGGHASMLLYSLLFLTGYDLTLEDIKNFRQWGSKTPGHPEYGHTKGVETTTGPLGQGIANSVGMAMAERHLAARFNKIENQIIDHYTYVIVGDGDMMEGIASEAASMAGHLGLGKLICLYDSNDISIEGGTNITFTENVEKRFEAYGWHILKINDGNDIDAIEQALNAAKKETKRPSLIILKTHIAYGSPNKQDTADAHGAPLGEEEVILTKKNLGYPDLTPFYVPDAALDYCRESLKKGEEAETKWNKEYELFIKEEPKLAAELKSSINYELLQGWDEGLPDFSAPNKILVATRSASGKVLNAIAKKVSCLIGGSADLAPSNKTFLEGEKEFQKESYEGRNIRFGVREHAMGAIMTGISLHGGLRSYGGTFLVFADYMRPAIRLAALMKQPVIYIFTHDSIAVGEDGPTHQPVEHIVSLRLIPGLIVIRPADALETKEAWLFAMKNIDFPIALILSRQKLPIIDRNIYASEKGLEKGAYILTDSDNKPDIILISTGAEVHLALAAKEIIEKEKIQVRVISMPSMELFEKQNLEYKEKVLPFDVKRRISIEAGISTGWEKYIKDGASISINCFGASAPGKIVLEKFGFNVQNVVNKALELFN